MIGQKIFGAAGALYSGSSYGRKVEGCKSNAVREFTITGETPRSWILDYRLKISKKHMSQNEGSFNTGAFFIYFFVDLDEAIASLSRERKA